KTRGPALIPLPTTTFSMNYANWPRAQAQPSQGRFCNCAIRSIRQLLSGAENSKKLERAQLNYLLPRLAGGSDDLSRLGGGIGTRGPGEQKLETDRRRIRDRVAKIRKAIENVRRQRANRRRARQGVPLGMIAFVGYTNAGKST